MNSTADNKMEKYCYHNYGVSSEDIAILEAENISPTALVNSRRDVLIRLGIPDDVIDRAKEAVKRKPIENNTLNFLFETSNRICCICKGQKGRGYIVHHIEEYSKSQNNNFDNLVVLCLDCHDEAHTKHDHSQNLSPDAIRYHKEKWMEKVEKHNLRMAIQGAGANYDILSVDYLNLPRIEELIVNNRLSMSTTAYYGYLLGKGLIDVSGKADEEKMRYLSSRDYLFSFWDGQFITRHYSEIFKSVLSFIKFENLEDLLTCKTLNSSGNIGKYCFFVHGLSSTHPSNISPKKANQSPVMFFTKRKIRVECLVDVTEPFKTSLT